MVRHEIIPGRANGSCNFPDAAGCTLWSGLQDFSRCLQDFATANRKFLAGEIIFTQIRL
jgi:hypothetical protein